MWNESAARRLARVAVSLIMLTATGTIGYMAIEGWPARDGFFMTVITLATVGYGETHPLTPTGRLFTTGLIFICLLSMTYFTATLTSILLEDDLSGRRFRRRTLKMIEKLTGHTIVCGSGPMALAVIDRLMKRGVRVVAVDSDGTQLAALKRRYRGLYTIDGDASSELTLAEAGLLSARHVVAALDSEVDNLMIAITCKDMGSNISVFARSNDSAVASRMRKAGVDEIDCPNQLCGDRFAELILA